jgi:cyclophilin family peptidyl-prolyl cis-trans isomerase
MVLCLGIAGAAQSGAQKPADTKKSTAAPKSGTAAHEPTAIIHTTAGDLKCELFPDKAPKTVANFIGLAKGTKDWKNPSTGQMEHGKPLYDGVIFHRTIPGFVIQAGDPTGSGSGDIGFTFEDEPSDLLYDRPGRLAMANRGPSTNSSQFFITESPLPALNPQPPRVYTIFGQCDDPSMELVKKIARMPCQGGGTCTSNNSRPENPVKITHIDIQNAPGAKSSASADKAAKTTKSSTKK